MGMRLKQVLFNTVISAYYSAFIPVSFAQAALSYEVWWVSQHTVLVFVGCLTLYFVYCFPAFYNQWSAASLWPSSAIVRHGRDLYKADGIINAAEPGNTTHIRFYYLFGDPSLLVCGLLVLQVSLVCIQLIILATSVYWHHLLSQGILLFSNYYT